MNREQPASFGAFLREFAAFLARPRLREPTGLRAPGAWRMLAMAAVLQVAVLLLLILSVVSYWQAAYALPAPDAFDQVPPELLVPFAVILAPIAEEIVFRGWLTGRARALWLLACAIGCGGVLYATTQGLAPLWAITELAALIIAAIAGWLILRKRGVPGWFTAAFPALFYLSVAAFSLSHVANYSEFSAIALPMVLPQLWAGLMLGFVRMRIGLLAAMLVHAISNGCALTLAMLASGAG